MAWLISFPVYPITGSALLVSIVALAGVRCAIASPVRDLALLIIGISIGTGVDAQVTAALAKWPVAFAVLTVMVIGILLVCRYLLIRFYGFTPRSATLAAAPGHLSFVISLGSALDIDVTPVAIVQAVRVLALTLSVPMVAVFYGVDIGTNILPTGAHMAPLHFVVLFIVSLLLSYIFNRLGIPAAFLIAAMLTSSIGQLSGLTPGTLPAILVIPCLIVVGVLIGVRFSGISIAQLLSNISAGLVTTAVTIIIACLVAIPVAVFLQMPTAHVLIAFSPGGLETMVAMGAALGANAGFVAACHVGRLFLLTLVVPVLTGKSRASTS